MKFTLVQPRHAWRAISAALAGAAIAATAAYAASPDAFFPETRIGYVNFTYVFDSALQCDAGIDPVASVVWLRKKGVLEREEYYGDESQSYIALRDGYQASAFGLPVVAVLGYASDAKIFPHRAVTPSQTTFGVVVKGSTSAVGKALPGLTGLRVQSAPPQAVPRGAASGGYTLLSCAQSF